MMKGQRSGNNYSKRCYSTAPPRRFKWRWVIGLGLVAVPVAVFGMIYKSQVHDGEAIREGPKRLATPWEEGLLKRLPLRGLSRAWGHFTAIQFPSWIETRLLSVYAWMFNCNLEEMEKPLESYASLRDFFTRSLKPGARPLADATMVSPVDGKVYYFGEVTEDAIEQVKGVQYPLHTLLGPIPEKVVTAKKGNTKLYHCGMYLAPGDYHGIHSPADWSVHFMRHFPGYLLPVAPVLVNFLAGLFALNERVVLFGKWQHGLFCMVPVGATNVGSIDIKFEKDLVTNQSSHKPGEITVEKPYSALPIKKGEQVGMFKLGSTVVLVFEAPADFQFRVKAGQTVRVGQPLGVCPTSNSKSKR